MKRIRAFVFSPLGRYNRLLISGKDRAAATGLLELDELGDSTLVTRLDLRFPDLFIGKSGHTVAGFLRLSKPFALDAQSNGRIQLETEAIFGVSLADDDLSYIRSSMRVSLDLMYQGCSLTGVAKARLPEDFPFDAGADFTLPLQGSADSFGRFRASFEPGTDVSGVRLTIAGTDWRQTVEDPREVDMLIPSHSTLTLDWERRADDGIVHLERDIMPDMILGPGQATDLVFSLFPPGMVPVLGAVVLAQEFGTDAQMEYRLTEEASGAVTIDTVIKGKPGRFALIDLVVASNDPARANSQVSQTGYFGVAASGALPISCNFKDPGGPNTPGSNPVLSNPPGGGGGAPDEPGPTPPSTPGPSSSTSDGGNTCDANYSVVFPPAGTLTLSTTVKPIGPDHTEIALVGVFRDGHKIANGRAELFPESGDPRQRRLNPLWIVAPGRHRLRVQVPVGWTLREVVEYEMIVDTKERLVTPIMLHAPNPREIKAGKPIVLADLGHGIHFSINDSMSGSDGLEVKLRNGSGGWIGVPGRYGEGHEMNLFEQRYFSLFVPAGIEHLHLPG